MPIKLGYVTSIFTGAEAILNSRNVGMDFISCLLGDHIGSGQFRDVYEHAMDPTKVIKIEYGSNQRNEHDCLDNNSFCNIQEFLLWREIEQLTGKDENVKDWFAPVHWISPGGHVLCMDKTSEEKGKPRPEQLPAFLSDIKYVNFGWIGDKFVCHDYAHVNNLTNYWKGMRKYKNIWPK